MDYQAGATKNPNVVELSFQVKQSASKIMEILENTIRPIETKHLSENKVPSPQHTNKLDIIKDNLTEANLLLSQIASYISTEIGGKL